MTFYKFYNQHKKLFREQFEYGVVIDKRGDNVLTVATTYLSNPTTEETLSNLLAKVKMTKFIKKLEEIGCKKIGEEENEFFWEVEFEIPSSK